MVSDPMLSSAEGEIFMSTSSKQCEEKHSSHQVNANSGQLYC